ncbi:hypothetical protein BDC45DRAFT_539908 [Circinella umbellata]|nr:hypothetical protein BDC45DRAFT_539908 [Circinella umbellata]
MMLSSPRSSIHNQKAKLAADYNDLLKQLSSPKMTVVGCYSIGETIGEGSYGKVKLGVHQITGKRVAIKKISKQHAPLMAREIHHHRQLRHPNIVTLFEILSTESAIFIVSEYCPNGELFDLLTESGRFTEQRAQTFFRQLVDAIRYCHERNIVHRDLKLENILIDAEQNARICDFGFARHADDKQLLETFCGSLAYSAPEVISQKRYTGPETDIWSLGIILYTLLAGELPFDDDSEIIMRRKIIALDYHIPSYFSPEAHNLIDNILKLDPKERLTMDQIVNHPWLTMIMDSEGDEGCEHMDNNNNNVNSIPEDCASVPSTHYSTYSDVDSLFSASMRHQEEDDFDLCSELSSPRSSTKPGTMLSNHFYNSSRPPSIIGQKMGSPSSPPTMTAYEKPRFATAQSPRFSAPTVSSRARITQPYIPSSSVRASLPNQLPSSAKRGSLFAQHQLNRLNQHNYHQSYDDVSAMAPIEQRLFAALTAAGFDESTVRNMRQSSEVGNALGTLWHMLMDNISKSEHMVSGVAVSKKKLDSTKSSQVVEKGTQTDDIPLAPSLSTSSSSSQSSASSRPSEPLKSTTTITTTTSRTAPNGSVQPSIHLTSIEGQPKVSVSSTQSHSTTNSQAERNGWFSSVKSWFGTTKQQQQQHQLHLEEQRIRAANAAYLAREIQESSPAYQSAGTNQQKYRRHMLQLSNPPIVSQVDQFSYNNDGNYNNNNKSSPLPPQYPSLARPQAAHNKPSIDSYYKAGNAFGPARPPTALTSPKSAVANTLSVVTTPTSNSLPATTAVPAKAVEIDVCEKRYAEYRSTNNNNNNIDNNNNRSPLLPVALEKKSQPQQQKEAPVKIAVPAPQRPQGIVAPKSPTPTTTSSTPLTPIRTTSPSGSPLSSQTSSLVEEEDEEGSSPASSVSTIDTPEEDNNNKLRVPPPSPTPTRSWPLAFRETSKNNPPVKRFEFAAPRSQLGIYNDTGRRKPLGAKVIIEEEEEEEE